MITWAILPNLLSVVRILLVFPCIFWLSQHDYGWALMVFLMAALTDGLDGGLAKRFGWVTRLGSLLDPIADKVLMAGVVITLGGQHYLPIWWVVGVVGRDLCIIFGALAYRTWIGYFEGRPSKLSKLNTFLQLLSVITVVSELYRQTRYNQSWQMILLSITFVTTVVSGLDYVLRISERANLQRPVRTRVT